MSFQVGDRVGDYEIIDTLGAGGMGRVYKVKNLISDRVDAMKILLPNLAGDPELADRFIREIKVLASLNHPNIAGLRTALRLENQLLMIMEFVEGTTLEDRLKTSALPVEEALEYILQVLSALAYAHQHEVIHRDIKPANMMLTPEGSVKLMDFGIARSKADRKLTTAGTTMGSLFYMSPEQVQAGELDGRSDLYSVGVSLYELVTGDRPFKGNSDYDLMVAQLQQIPLPPIERRPDLPKALNDVILIAMEKDPAKRFQTAEAFAAALGNVREMLGVAPTVLAGAPPAEVAAGYATTGPLNALPVQPEAVPLAPQVSPPTVTPTPVVQAPPPAAASKGYRGLYMTLGALIALGIVVLAATQIPRWLKARAGGDQAATHSTPATASPNAPTTETADNGQRAPVAGFGGAANPAGNDQVAAVPASGGMAASGEAPPLGGGAPGLRDQTAAPSPSAGPTPTGTTAKKTAHPSRVANQAVPAPASKSDATLDQASEAPQAPVAGGGGEVAQPPATQASVDQGKVLEELRDRMTSQGARASAMKDSVESLRQRQVAQGFTLRPDISASLNRMEQYMNKADAAISAGDAEAGRKYADLAEREIENLEKFFGR